MSLDQTTTDSSLTDAMTAFGTLQSSMTAAAQFTNADFSPAKNEAERAVLIETAVSTARQSAVNAYTQAQTAANAAESLAAPHRPQLDADNIAQLTRVEIAWRNNIVPLLEAGRSWAAVVNAVDTDGALAIEKFARTRLLAEHDNPLFPTHSDVEWVDREMNGIMTALRNRHGSLAATEEGREAIAQADKAAANYQAVAGIAGAVHGVTRPSQLAAASIQAKSALRHLS